MSGIPLIETNNPGLIIRGYNLGMKIVPNLLHVLTAEKLEYYETHLSELKDALAKGLVLPQQEEQATPAIVPTPALFKSSDTDLNFWIAKTEEFAKKYIGVEINLRERFAIPAELPWASVIPVFDPGGITNRGAVEKALKSLGLAVYEEVDVMNYSGSKANKEPTLHFIQNSLRPDDDTMGLSPNQLVATNKNWLDLRGYALAFGVHHFATGEYLDPRTWTRFPNARLADGEVANGHWLPDNRRVKFDWYHSDYRNEYRGARLAIRVPLLP